MGAGRIIVAALLVSVPAAAMDGLAEAAPVPCEGHRRMPGIGPVCPTDDGLFAMLGPEGDVLGHTHGPDFLEATGAPTITAAPVRPACVDPVTDYHHLVIYAFPSNRLDRYAQRLPGIRAAVDLANGQIRADAAEAGMVMDLKFACDPSGAVTVRKEQIEATPQGLQDGGGIEFTVIHAQLRARGYSSPRVKYWVWYDDAGACACLGAAQAHTDDELASSNFANGWSPGSYAITYAKLDPVVMLHEGGHILGAVQNSAPHSSKAGHCNQGLDVMCYRDGGSAQCASGGFYCVSDCPVVTHFDCAHDDFFNPLPAAGSYLATHWNIASPLNRFIRFQPCFESVGLAPPPAVFGRQAAPVVVTGIPAECADRPFALYPEPSLVLVDLDLCWLDPAGATVRCDTAGFDATGRVPAGAAGARITINTGAAAQYVLRVI